MIRTVDRFVRVASRRYDIGDLSVVIGLRAHEGNPWVLERLANLGGYYDPAPRFVVADMGSEGTFAERLADICRRFGLAHVRVDSPGLFSPAAARNAGAVAASTELLFFSDVDCVGERDLFARIVAHANAIDLGRHPAQAVILPVYHLTRSTSEDIAGVAEPERRSEAIASAMARSVYSRKDDVAEYVDPFSNFFACRRDFFKVVGGYDERFVGHGSEDFEFFIRSLVCADRFPLPEDPAADVYGPHRESFFGAKAFRGFRRAGELAAYGAETAGLRLVHLFHPRSEADSWYRHNDWRRERFDEYIRGTLSGWEPLMQKDWLPRSRTAAVVIRGDDDARRLIALRVEGYRLHPVHCHETDRVELVQDLITRGRHDAVALLDDEPTGELRGRLEQLAPRSEVEIILVSPEAGARTTGTVGPVAEFDPSSYAAGRMGTNVRVGESGGLDATIPENVRRRLPPSVREEPPVRRLVRKARKLVRSPNRFMAESRVPLLRWLGDRLR